MSIDGQRAGSAQHRVSPVAAGLAVFAGALMIVSGIGAVVEGIAAVFNEKGFVPIPQYLYAFDLTAWGWIHLFLVCWSDSRVSRHPRAAFQLRLGSPLASTFASWHYQPPGKPSIES